MTDADEQRARRECAADARANRLDSVLAAKRAATHGAAFEPLRRFVASIRTDDRLVPDFDPFFGGVDARVLVLLEAPGAKATVERGGSGFISPDNADGTAATVWRLMHESGLRREAVVFWNVVPWYLGDETRIAAARRLDVGAAAESLHQFVQLLTGVRVVLALGNPARDGWLAALRDPRMPLIPTLAAPHPSPRGLASRPSGILELQRAFARAADVADEGSRQSASPPPHE